MAIINPFPGTIRLATPLIFGALAGCLCERSGVINIAIEGQFLMGAFFAAVASQPVLQRGDGPGRRRSSPASPWPRCSASSRSRYQVNQVVLGVVLIALATGLTDFLLSQIPDDPEIKKYLNEPLILEKIPVSGPGRHPGHRAGAVQPDACSSTSCTARSSS